jgi:hypothetical protein
MDSNLTRVRDDLSSRPRDAGDAGTLKFLHLPKTAGTSVRSFLKRFFRPEEICPASFRDEFRALGRDKLASYRMFAGHLDWEDLDEVKGPSFTFTVLREPRERLLSYYFFQRAEAVRMARDEPGRVTKVARAALALAPDDFFCTGGPPSVRLNIDNQLDNHYAHYFARRSARLRYRSLDRAMPGSVLVAMARRNLDRLDGVFATEQLEPLKWAVIARFGGREVGAWRTALNCLYPIQRIRRNQNAGTVATRLADLAALGATWRTFDRIEEMTHFDSILWGERFGRRP